MERETLLTRTFVELTDNLADDFDPVDMMVLLAERVVALTEGDAAGLLLVDEFGLMRLVASTSEASETIELFQIQNEEGPCRECCLTGMQMKVADVATAAHRWPSFVPAALREGYRSIHSFPLRLRFKTVGTLSVFGKEPLALSASDLEITQALVNVATIAVLQARAAQEASRVTGQLQHALESRVTIEQAKGVVAEQGMMNMSQSFDLLRSFSRRSGRLLTDVCWLVVAGTISHDEMVATSTQQAVPPEGTRLTT